MLLASYFPIIFSHITLRCAVSHMCDFEPTSVMNRNKINKPQVIEVPN